MRRGLFLLPKIGYSEGMSSGNLARNTSLFTVAMALQKVLSFFYFVYLARSIGVEDVGRFSFALSFTAIFAMVLDAGMTQVLIRQSAQSDQSNVRRYVGSVLMIKALGMVAIYLMAVVSVNLLGYEPVTRQLVYISGLVMILDSFAVSIYGVMRGQHDLRFESIGVVLNQFAVMVCGGVALYLGLALPIVMAAYMVGSLVNLTLGILAVRRYELTPIISDWTSLIKPMIRLALPFAIAGLFIRIYSSIDIIMLSKLAGDYQVGIYSVAYKIAFALQFIAVAFSASLYPAFCSLITQSMDKLADYFSRSLVYLLLISAPLTGGVIALGPAAVHLLFGSQYNESFAPLLPLMLSLVFSFLSFPVGALLNAGHRQTRNTVHLGIIAVVNATLNFILIPLYGSTGAGIATLLSYGLLFVLGMVVAHNMVHYDWRWLLVKTAGVFISTTLMMICVLMARDYLPLAVSVLVGVISYSVGIYLSRTMTVFEVKQLVGLIMKKS